MNDNWNRSRDINRWRVDAPRHDTTANLVSNLFQIFEFKTDRIQKTESWIRRISGKYFQNRWLEMKIQIDDFRVMSHQKNILKIFPDNF